MFIFVPVVAASLFLCADVKIQQVVPETTIAVISTDSVGDLIKHLKSSGVCDTMIEMCSTVGEEYGEVFCFTDDAKYAEICDALGMDKKTWNPPTGHAGFAVYPVVDYEIGNVGIGLFGMIELDEKIYGELYSDKFETLLSEAELEIDSVNLSGRDVWVVHTDIAKKPQVPDFIASGAFDRVYIVYSDSTFMFGTEPDAIAAALLALDGDFEEDMLDSNEDFISLLDRCGNEGDIFAGMLLTNLADTIIQMDQTQMSMMILPSVKTFIGDVDGIAELVRFSPTADVFVDVTYTALMNDGRSGLIGLFGANEIQQTIPNFVQPEVLSYSQGQIDLDKFVDLVKESVQNNPMFAFQMGGQMDQIEAGLNLFFDPLGSKYHSFSTGQLPFDANTIGYLFAIECTDEKAFSNALALTLPMAGAQPSDFLGNQIFTINIGDVLPLPMSMDISIAVGGGFSFIGTTKTVEDALRTIANPNSRKSTRITNAATSYIQHDDVSSWGYGDLKTSIEIQNAMMEALNEEMYEEINDFDPEMAAEMRKDFEKQSKIQESITNAITSMLGPMAWNLTTDDTGLNAHAIMLKP